MPGADDHLKFLSEKVSLDQAQQARITIILEDQIPAMQAIRKDAFLSQEERLIKLRRLREDSAVKVGAQLNAEQKKKFDDMRQDTRERLKERQERGEDCSMIWMALE